MRQKPKARLDPWAQVKNYLIGRVSGHKHRPDGNWVHTSIVISITPDRKQAITLNTIYELGEEMTTKAVFRLYQGELDADLDPGETS